MAHMAKNIKTNFSEMEKEIGNVLTGMMTSINKECAEMSEADLESKWFFKFDHDKTPRQNLYQFFDMLHLYRSHCRRWEEMHNGHSCVVERVRDKYLMPKIDQFLKCQKGSV